MSTQSGYGYQDAEELVSAGGGQAGEFGLNQKNVFLKKWEYILNGGKGGAEGEALDIVFEIDGIEKGYRKFPVTKAFLPNNAGETSDPTSPEMIAAFKDQNAVLTHILDCFIPKDVLIRALSVPNVDFKAYCNITGSLLPSNFRDLPLDMFLHWQWQFSGEAKKTYLEIPKKMKTGRWIAPAHRPFEADGVSTLPTTKWVEQRLTDFNAQTPNVLTYVDGAGNMHPFTRNGYFMQSNNAVQQHESGAGNAANNMAPTTGVPATAYGTAGAAPLPQATQPAAGTPPAASGGW